MKKPSIVKFLQLEKNLRLDANYYLNKYIDNQKFLDSMNSVEIGSPIVSKLVTDGDHGYPTYVDEGIYYIKSKEVSCLDIDYSGSEKVSYSYAKKLGDRCKLNKEDVIITTVGKIGNVYIVKEDIPKSVLSRDIAKIVVNKENILPEYLYLFLNSKYGQLQIQRYSSGSIQRGLYIYAIKKIQLPLIDMEIQKILSERVTKIIDLKNESKKIINQAKTLLNEKIF